MKIAGKVVVVTGGASGIGRALCRRFAAEGARGVVVADRSADGAVEVAAEIGGLAVEADVAVEKQVQRVVAEARERYGEIDLFCCNAGVFSEGGVEVSNEEWKRVWDVNFMSIVYAARALLPSMLERGNGAFLITASAAGLLTQVGSAPYSVTKHAALSLAEWLSMTHADDGIEVFCLCPQGVNTAMMNEFEADSAIGGYLRSVALEPDDVAGAVIDAMAAGQFLVLPHPEVADFFQRKATDYDRWLGGMRRFQASVGSNA